MIFPDFIALHQLELTLRRAIEKLAKLIYSAA